MSVIEQAWVKRQVGVIRHSSVMGRVYRGVTLLVDDVTRQEMQENTEIAGNLLIDWCFSASEDWDPWLGLGCTWGLSEDRARRDALAVDADGKLVLVFEASYNPTGVRWHQIALTLASAPLVTGITLHDKGRWLSLPLMGDPVPARVHLTVCAVNA